MKAQSTFYVPTPDVSIPVSETSADTGASRVHNGRTLQKSEKLSVDVKAAPKEVGKLLSNLSTRLTTSLGQSSARATPTSTQAPSCERQGASKTVSKVAVESETPQTVKNWLKDVTGKMRSTADRYLPVAGTEQEDIRKYDFNQAFFVVELKRQTRIALEDATNDHAPKQGDLPQDAEARQAFVNNVSSAIATFGEKFPKEGWLQPLAASFFAELKTILSESASPPITPQTAETSPKSVLRISDSEILPLSRQDETDNGIASGSENPGASLGATRRERSNSLSEGAPSDFGHRDVRKFKRSKSVGDLSAQMAPAKPPRLVETENPRSALEDQAATVTNNIAARVNSPLPRVLVKNDINEFINQTLTQIDSMDDKQHHSINGSTVSAGFFGKVLKKDFFTQLETSASTLLSGKEYITATDFMQDLKVQTFDKMTALHAAKGPVENDIPRVFLKMISDLKDHFLPAQSQNVHRGFRSLIGSSTQLSLRSFPGRAIRHFFDKPPTNR